MPSQRRTPPLSRRRAAAPQAAHWLLRPVHVAVCLLLAAPAVWALPSGGVPSFGSVQQALTDARTLTIVQTSARAGIDWQSFSIAAGERVNLRQPDAQSVLFSRVSGADPSLIFGQLQANGRVFLSNPRGIIFGAGSQVDVGGLVATTLDLQRTPEQGRYRLSQGSAEPAELRAEGEIYAPQGTVALVAPRLSVAGKLVAGRVGLAALGSVQVDVEGDGLVFFNARDEGLAARLAVLGTVHALAGTADLRAAARAGFADTVLNLSGIVRASGLARRGAQVVIDGGGAGSTVLSGRIDVASTEPGSSGGSVSLRGAQLLLGPASRIDASGPAGGGTVQVGGDWQGQPNPSAPGANARTTQMAAGARIDASATQQGDGGRVVLWADGLTQFDGRIVARGGPAGGHGGAVETSGKHGLSVHSGQVDAGASSAKLAGSWLLDPDNIDVKSGGAATLIDVADINSHGSLTIDPAVLNAAVATVSLQASNNISFCDPVSLGMPGVGLEARAGKAITVNASISTNGGAITLSANDPVAGSARDNSAAVVLNFPLNAAAGMVTISQNGGSGSHTLQADISADRLSIVGAAQLVGSHSFTLANAVVGSTLGDGLTGTGSLTKAGAGLLTLSGSNSYSGGTTLSAGSLKLGSAGALPTGGDLTVSGGSLDIAGQSPGVGVMRLVAGSIVDSAVVKGALTGSEFQFESGSVDAILAGTAGLSKSGPGTVTLGAANSYTGATTVSAGKLLLGVAGALASNLIQVDGGSLDSSANDPFSDTSATLNVASGASLNLGGTASVGVLNLSGALNSTGGMKLTVSGATSLSGGTVNSSLVGGSLSSSGVSAINAPVVAATATVSGGSLTIGSGGKLTAATTVAAGAALVTATGVSDGLDDTLPMTVNGSLTLGGDETVGAFSLGGTLASGGKLTAPSVLLSGGTVNSALTGGSLSSSGVSAINAKVAASSATVSGGSLTIGSGGKLTAATTVAAGAALVTAPGVSDGLDDTQPLTVNGSLTLGGDETVGAFSLGGTLASGGKLTAPSVLLSGGTVNSALTGGSLSSSGVSAINAPVAASSATVSGGSLTIGSGGKLTAATTVAAVAALVTAPGVSDGLDDSRPLTVNGSLRLGGDETVGVFSLGGTLASGGKLTASSVLLSGGTVNSALAGGSLSSSGASAINAPVVASSATVSGGSLTSLTIGSGGKLTAATTVAVGAALVTAPGVSDGLDDTQPLTVNGSLSLGGDESIGALAGASGANIVLGSRTLTTRVSSGLSTFAGSISGVGGKLVKEGAGRLTLSGSNSHSGGSQVNGGILGLSGGSALSDSAPLGVAAGAALAVDTAETVGALGLSGSLSGAATLSAASASLSAATVSSPLAVSGALSSSGATRFDAAVSAATATVTAGTLTLGSAGKLTAATTVAAGAALVTAPGVSDGLDDTQPLTVNGSLSLGGDESIGTLAGASGASIDLGSRTLSTRIGSGSSSFAGAINGVGGRLVKAGAGTLTLSGVNGYGGGTLVSEGTLAPLGGSALASGGAVDIASGAALNLLSDQTIGALSGSGSLTLAAGATLTSAPGAGLTASFAGTISGPGGLTKSGAGAWHLLAAETYTGLTSVSAGTLTLEAGASLASAAISVSGGSLQTTAAGQLGPGLPSLAVGGNLVLAGSEAVAGLSGGAGGTIILASGATLTTRLAGGAASYAGRLSGAGDLLKAGPGRQGLSGSSSYSGGSRVSAGVLELSGASPLGSGQVNVTAPGALAVVGDAGIAELSGDGALTLASGATLTSTVASGTVGYSGAVGGGGGLAKAGLGTWVLSGASSYSGGTTVSAGTLQLDAASAAGVGAMTLAGLSRLALTTSAGTGALAGSGAVTLADGVTLTTTVASGLSSSFGGVVSGKGGLTKAGAGALTLTAAQTYSGATSVDAGTLSLGGGASLASPTVHVGSASLVTSADGQLGVGATALSLDGSASLAGNESIGVLSGAGTLSLASGKTLSLGAGGLDSSFAGAINGGGGLAKFGAATLLLSSASSSYSGGTTVNAGTLRLDGASAAGSGGLSLAGGAVLEVNEDLGTGALSGSGASRLASGKTLTTTVASGSVDYSGPISGGGALAKAGAGTWVLSGANSFGGGTTVGAGVLRLTGDAALAVGDVAVFATLDLPGNTSIGALSGSGKVTLADSSTLTTAPGSGVASRFGGVISGKGGLTKSGAGSLTLSAAQTYTGATQVRDGSLNLAAGAGLSSTSIDIHGGSLQTTAAGQLGPAAPALTVDAELVLAGSEAVGALAGGSAGTIALAAGATLTSTLAGGASSLYAGSLSGAGALAKAGPGRLVLSGANHHAGGTAVRDGVLQLDNASAAGSAALTIAAPGAVETSSSVALAGLTGDGSLSLASGTSLNIQPASGATFNFSGSLDGAGALVKSGDGTQALSGPNHYSGGTVVDAGVLRLGHASAAGSGAVAVHSAASLEIASDVQIAALRGDGAVALAGGTTLTVAPASGVDSGFAGVIRGDGGLSKSGAGGLSLSAVQTYRGATSVSAGTLTLAAGAALASAAIMVDGGSLQTSSDGQFGGGLPALTVHGSLNLGGDETVGSLSGSSSGRVVLAAGKTLSSDVAAGSSALFAGQLSGAGALAKQGSGTLILTGANSHGGGTRVSAGLLQLGNVAAAGTGPLSLAAAGALAVASDASISDLSGSGATTLATGATLNVTVDGAAVGYGGAIGGAGALVKSGSGRWTLSGASGFSGGTTVNAGTLRLAAASAAGVGAMALAGPATLEVALSAGTGALSGSGAVILDSGATLTTSLASGSASSFSGPISGGGGLTKSGDGRLTLAAAASYSGSTTVSAGTLVLGAGAALATTSIRVSGGSLQTSADGQLSAATPALAVDGGLVLAGSESVGALSGGSGGRILLAGGKVLSSRVEGGASSSFAGVITGGGDLRKSGDGELRLSGANRYSGSTDVSAGTLSLTSGASLASTALRVASGAGLQTSNDGQLPGFAGSPPEVLLDGTLTLAGNEALGALSGAASGALNLASGKTLSLTLGSGLESSFSGVISGSGAALRKLGAGTLALSGANRYSGGTAIDAGTLRLAADDALAAAAGLSLDGGSLDLAGHSLGVGLLQLRSGQIVDSGATKGSLHASAFAVEAGRIDAVLDGSGGLSKTGPGSVSLSGLNRYSGGTQVSAGSLLLEADGVLPGGGPLTLSGGMIDLAGTRQTAGSVSLLAGRIGDSASTKGSLSANSLDLQAGTVDAALTGPAGLSKTGSGTVLLSGANSFSGGTTVVAGRLQLQGGAALPAGAAVLLAAGAAPTLELLDTATLGSLGGGADANLKLGAYTLSVGGNGLESSFDGLISGSGGLIKTGPARWSLGGSNSFSGSTVVLGGSIAIRADSNLGAAPSLVEVGQLRLDGGGIELRGAGPAAAELAATRGLRVGDGGASIVVEAGKTLTLRGPVSASSSAVGLTKTGAGGLSLAGDNPFNGSLLIAQGSVNTLGSARLSNQLRLQIGNGGRFGLGGDETLVSVSDAPGQVADGSALLDLGAHTMTVVSPGDGVGHFSGSVVGPGSFVKLGGGSVELAGSGSGSGLFHVSGGTLLITGAGTLGSDNRVEVDPGATLRLGRDAGIRSLLLSGSLAGPGELSVSGSTVLSGGSLLTPLATASLNSIGDSLIGAALRVSGSSAVLGGQLRIGAAGSLSTPVLALAPGAALLTEGDGRLLAGPALSLAAGASATLGGSERLASLALSGQITAATGAPATARLTVDGRVALDGGSLGLATSAASLSSVGSSTVSAPLSLSGGALLSGGTLLLSDAGSLDTPSLDVSHATLRLGAGTRLLRPTALSLGQAARVELGGDETIATLSDRAAETADGSATLALLGHRLTLRSDATDSRFSGRLVDGLGSARSGDVLVKDGSGSLTLLADSDLAQLQILGGSVQLGDGGSAGSVSQASIDNQGLLRVVRADSFSLSAALSGSGALQQDGSGSLLLANPGNSYSGSTTVSQGVLRAGGGGHLSPNSAVLVAAAGQLRLDGDERLASIQADGKVTLGGSLSSSGDQIFRGPVKVSATAPISLLAPGQVVDARNDANRWGSQPLSVDARSLRLSAGKTASGDYQALVLGQLRLGVDGQSQASSDSSRIDAGQISLGQVSQVSRLASADPRLDGLLRLASGSLTLSAHALPGYTPLAETAVVDPLSGKHLALADSVLQQSANSRVETLPGSLLSLLSPAAGGIDFSQPGNHFGGAVEALTGADWGTPWSARPVPATNLAGQSQVSLAGDSVLVGGNGIEADLVRISAAGLATASGSVITARLWFNDALFGSAQSTPGLRLNLQDAAFATRQSFGSVEAPIATRIGAFTSAAPGSGTGSARPGLQAGFVQLLPKAGAHGSTAVFLSGPQVGVAGYSLFNDGAGVQNEIALFYNGVLPTTPQLSGSLSAVASVSETARKDSLEEAVRTENVAVRVRSGVIAEVGPGRPATVGADGTKPPASCPPAAVGLGCAADPPLSGPR